MSRLLVANNLYSVPLYSNLIRERKNYLKPEFRCNLGVPHFCVRLFVRRNVRK